MNILLIGGTGTISMAISRRLLAQGHRLYLLNRGSRADELEARLPDGSSNRPVWIRADVNDEENTARRVGEVIAAQTGSGAVSRPFFDAVADFIAFVPEQLERDYRIFAGKTKQFLYISTASAYQTPPADYLINESTPLQNPHWEYSRRKIRGEDYLMTCYRREGFPVTIVRPSHTFDERNVPVELHGDNGSWQVLRRMLDGKPVIIPGGCMIWRARSWATNRRRWSLISRSCAGWCRNSLPSPRQSGSGRRSGAWSPIRRIRRRIPSSMRGVTASSRRGNPRWHR